MDPERIIGELIGGFLGGKKSRKHGGFGLSALGLGGSRHGGYAGHRSKTGGLVNAGTLLTVGGLIWGAIETMQQGNAGTAAGGTPAPPPTSAGSPGALPRSVMSPPTATPGLAAPPPLPPPIPGATPAQQAQPPALPVPAALLPLVQLAVSAARADGEMSDEEVAVIRARAQDLGAQALVDQELAARRPLDAITPAFTTPEQRQLAYALAYAVVHGQDAVSPGERMYLTQLQRLLQLDHADVERLERETLAGGPS